MIVILYRYIEQFNHTKLNSYDIFWWMKGSKFSSHWAVKSYNYVMKLSLNNIHQNDYVIKEQKVYWGTKSYDFVTQGYKMSDSDSDTTSLYRAVQSYEIVMKPYKMSDSDSDTASLYWAVQSYEIVMMPILKNILLWRKDLKWVIVIVIILLNHTMVDEIYCVCVV